MTRYNDSIPQPVIKPSQMFLYLTSKARLLMIIIGIILFIYTVIFMQGMYYRSKRFNRMMAMVLENKKHILLIDDLDQDLLKKIEHLKKHLQKQN